MYSARPSRPHAARAHGVKAHRRRASRVRVSPSAASCAGRRGPVQHLDGVARRRRPRAMQASLRARRAARRAADRRRATPAPRPPAGCSCARPLIEQRGDARDVLHAASRDTHAHLGQRDRARSLMRRCRSMVVELRQLALPEVARRASPDAAASSARCRMRRRSPYRTMSRSIVRGAPARAAHAAERAARCRCSAASSARGASVVSRASIWFRYGPCAARPSGIGLLHATTRASSREPGSSDSAARAAARYAGAIAEVGAERDEARITHAPAPRDLARAASGPPSGTCGLRTATRHRRHAIQRQGAAAMRRRRRPRDSRAARRRRRRARARTARDSRARLRAGPVPHDEIDLERLRMLALVRQDAHAHVESHADEGDLREAVRGAHVRAVHRSQRDARDATGELAEVGRHVAQLLRGALQLAQRRRLVARARGHLLRAIAIAAGDAGDAPHALAQLGELELLLARRARRCAARRSRRSPSPRRSGRAPRAPARTASPRPARSVSPRDIWKRDAPHLLLEGADDVARLVRRAGALLRELAHLVRDDGEPLRPARRRAPPRWRRSARAGSSGPRARG